MKGFKKLKLVFKGAFSKSIAAVVLISIICGMFTSCNSKVYSAAPQPNIATTAVKYEIPEYTGNIPNDYKGLYNFLDASLDKMETQKGSFNTMVSSNLLSANSNSLPDIAESPQNFTTIEKTLDRFVDMGLKVVDITIQYPTLVKGFPHSGDYLEYYKKVFQEVKKRNLKITVEVGSTFTSPMFAKLPVNDWYSGLTKERYCKEKRQMIETIINELAPDYLTIEEEPTTQQTNLGLSYSVEDAKNYVDYFLKDLDTKNIPIGAGAGLWDDEGYWDLYLNNPSIDFLNFHIYPIYDSELKSKLESLSKRAAEKGKKVVVGEAWLYKTNGDEKLGGPVAMSEVIFGRDAYSFWQPLDCKFIDALLNMASTNNWEFVNFFWSKCFFGYVEYNNAAKNPKEAFTLQQKAATPNIYKNRLTSTGMYLKERLIKE